MVLVCEMRGEWIAVYLFSFSLGCSLGAATLSAGGAILRDEADDENPSLISFECEPEEPSILFSRFTPLERMIHSDDVSPSHTDAGQDAAELIMQGGDEIQVPIVIQENAHAKIWGLEKSVSTVFCFVFLLSSHEPQKTSRIHFLSFRLIDDVSSGSPRYMVCVSAASFSCLPTVWHQHDRNDERFDAASHLSSEGFEVLPLPGQLACDPQCLL